MSKRSKKKHAPNPTSVTTSVPTSVTTTATASAASADVSPSSGPEILRRMLVAVLTLLIVARPFVWGEDAGLLSEFAEPSGMVLTMLTFLACVGWAAWRLWERQGGVHLGAIEVTLFLLAVLFIVGANFAAYARPAWFTAMDWLGLVLLLFLTRQLAARTEEQHGLMTVLLATAVALCAQGVFQVSYQLPRLAKEMSKETRPTERAIDNLAVMRGVAATDLERRQLMEQLEKRHVSGPYLRPSSLADCLVLLVPLLGGAVVACVRNKSTPLFTGVVGVCVLLGGVVLGMTRDVTAIAAVALAALPWIGLQWPARMGGWLVGGVLGLAAAAGVVYVLHRTGRLAGDVEHWREVWPSAYAMGDSRFWTGVGPAQFRFYYPRFMKADAGYKVPDPSSSLLEVFDEVGVGGVVLLLVALALLARTVARWWGTSLPPEDFQQSTQPPKDESQTGEVRWEYYLGGMLATILSFALRANSVSPTEVTTEAIAAGVRSVCWFSAFALFERVSWTPREYVGSLVVGIAGLLLAFLVGPGLSHTGVAALLWVAVGLVLAIVRPQPASWRLPDAVTRFLPGIGMRFAVGSSLASLLALAFAYFTLALFPASVSTAALREARFQRVRFKVEREKGDAKLEDDAEKFIKRELIDRLREASKEDASNSALWVALAYHSIDYWLSIPPYEAKRRNEVAEEAIKHAKDARLANPEGEESYLAEFAIHETIGTAHLQGAKNYERQLEADDKIDPKKASKDDKKEKSPPKMTAQQRKLTEAARDHLHEQAKLAFANAADALEPYLSRDPHNADLRFRLAHALDRTGKKSKAEEVARTALAIDKEINKKTEKDDKDRPRSLSDQQRKRLEEILGNQFAP